MPTEFPSKKDLTRIFLFEAGMPTDEEDVKQYLWIWWTNPISRTSLRLTALGAAFLINQLNLEHYDYKLTDDTGPLPSKVLLQMDKHLTVPFHLAARKKIIFFGEQDAVMLALHGNHLTNYLSSFS